MKSLFSKIAVEIKGHYALILDTLLLGVVGALSAQFYTIIAACAIFFLGSSGRLPATGIAE